MNKKEILKTFDIASFVAIAIATILVFVYQFVGEYLTIKFAVIMYTVSFALMAVFYGLSLFYLLKKTEQNGEAVVPENGKNQKTILIIKTVLSAMVFAFTLVVLIMF